MRGNSNPANASISEHFEPYLFGIEAKVKKLAEKASSPEELHELRLSIKKWRYLLTDCLGLTNREIVMAQTILGEIHDLDRIQPELEKYSTRQKPRNRLKKRRQSLLESFDEIRMRLPYGLRPGIISQGLLKVNL